MGAFAELVRKLEGHANPANPANLTPIHQPDSQHSQYSQGVRANTRDHLRQLAAAHCLDADLVDGIPDDEINAYDDQPDQVLVASLRVLHEQRLMAAKTVPTGWTVTVQCRGCGPVFLWPGCPSHVIACPWCRHRKAGTSIPTPPPSSPLQDNSHGTPKPA